MIGVVADSYISKKQRKNKVGNFGFIRFHNREDAERAVKRFDGLQIFGSKLHVSMAKYRKDGSPVSRNIKAVYNYLQKSKLVTGNRKFEQLHTVVQTGGEKIPVRPTPFSAENIERDKVVTLAEDEVKSDVLSEMVTMPTNLGSSTMVSRNDREEGHTMVHTVASAPVVDGVPKSNTVDKDKASSTLELIRMETLGNLEKSRSCRPRTL